MLESMAARPHFQPLPRAQHRNPVAFARWKMLEVAGYQRIGHGAYSNLDEHDIIWIRKVNPHCCRLYVVAMTPEKFQKLIQLIPWQIKLRTIEHVLIFIEDSVI